MKLTSREKLVARYSKGLDGGDWVLLVWVASLFIEIPTALWVVVWMQFAVFTITSFFWVNDIRTIEEQGE